MNIGGNHTKNGLFLVLALFVGMLLLPSGVEAACSKEATWTAGVCGCDWKGEEKPTNYKYEISDTDKTADGWECQKGAWGVEANQYCCNMGNWTPNMCGRGWEEPYGPIKNDYQTIKTTEVDKQTKLGWTCEANKWGVGTDESCCKKAKAATPGSSQTGAAIPNTGSTAEWKYQNEEKTGLLLVDCTKDGVCEIADLVQQGINFAKWLMGLSGALFLVVFVYGGAMYLASFGRSDYVKKGQNAMVRGAFGIILVMGAWTIVSYVATSLGYKAVGLGADGEKGGKKGVCGMEAGTEGKSCFDTKKDADKIEAGSCVQGYCSGAAEMQCCKGKAGTSAGATGTGSCTCNGTITEGWALKALPGHAIFDSYCPIVKPYCPVCGGGTATCAITIDVSKEECEKQDFDALAQKLGIPSPALNAVNLSGTCTFKGSK